MWPFLWLMKSEAFKWLHLMTLSDSFWIKQPWLLGTGLNSTQMAHTKVLSTQPPSLFALGLLHAALSLFEHWRKQRCLNRRGSSYNSFWGCVWLQTKISTTRERACCLCTFRKNGFASQSVVNRRYLHVDTNPWIKSAWRLLVAAGLVEFFMSMICCGWTGINEHDFNI